MSNEFETARPRPRRVIITKPHRYDPPGTLAWHREFMPGPEPIIVPAAQYESLVAAEACELVDGDV